MVVVVAAAAGTAVVARVFVGSSYQLTVCSPINAFCLRFVCLIPRNDPQQPRGGNDPRVNSSEPTIMLGSRSRLTRLDPHTTTNIKTLHSARMYCSMFLKIRRASHESTR